MNTTLNIWIASLVSVLFYFILKALRAKKDATAVGDETFNIRQFFANDLLDVVVALVAVSLVLLSGNDFGLIPIKIVDVGTAVMASFGICSLGVNVILGALGLGNSTRKKARKIASNK